MSGTHSPWSPQGIYPEGVNWATDIGTGTLLTMLNDSVAKYGDKPCLSHMGYRLTYKQFDALVDKAARGLAASGIRPGDRVGMFMPNTPYFPIMFFAILRSGATAVNFSSTYAETPDKLAAQIQDSGTTTMITMDLKPFLSATRTMIADSHLKNAICCPMHGVLPLVKSLAFRILKSSATGAINSGRNGVLSFSDLLDIGQDYRTTLPKPKPDDLAILQYTGGTTGLPKGAMLSHFNVLANTRQINAMYGARPDRAEAKSLLRPGQEKFLTTIPFFHIYGLTVGIFTPLNIGAEIEILPDPRDIKKTLQTIESAKPTVFPAVPRILYAITENKDLPKYNLNSIRSVISGGAALPFNVCKAFEKAASNCKILQGYGLSETSPVAAVNPPTGPNKTHTIGVQLPNTEMRIADLSDPSKDAPHGTDGEICIRGPQVMQGYWNKPSETEKVIDDKGWFYTGDVGHFDEDGYIHITDRLKRMASINGMKFYPNMIEQTISKHPSIAECVVIRLNKGSLSETLKAVIRFRPDATDIPTEKDLREFVKDKMTDKEIPRIFEFRTEELPKTAALKPDWNRMEQEESNTAPIAGSPKP